MRAITVIFSADKRNNDRIKHAYLSDTKHVLFTPKYATPKTLTGTRGPGGRPRFDIGPVRYRTRRVFSERRSANSTDSDVADASVYQNH